MQFSLSTAVVALAALVGTVVGETHTVRFDNRCDFGTPTLIQNGVVLSTGPVFTIDGPLNSTIAYLQIGTTCGFNGENCTLIETTLENVAPGNSGSLTDINVTPPHKFSVPSGFRYYNGCDGSGADCTSPDCQSAPVSCLVDNIDLIITFCD